MLPLTQHRPKCLLRIGACTVLEWQLRMLAAAGVDDVVVVVGFGAAAVERELAHVTPAGMRVRTLFNELYDRTDNLVSCMRASAEMDEDFLLVNGDTLADPTVVRRLFTSRPVPVALAVASKEAYDADDMKVRSAGRRVIRIGKDLAADETDGEAIGFSLYRGTGPGLFTDALAEVLREPEGSRRWYLSAVNLLAGRGHVHRVAVAGARWAEIDYPQDLEAAQKVVACLAEQSLADATRAWTTGDASASQDEPSLQPDLRAGSAR